MTENSDRAQSDEPSYEGGTVVLAKLKGFPAWPGMIVDESNLTPEVIKAKPKANSKTSKKAQGDGRVWPVKFFVDNNFMWASKTELKLLSVEDAQKYLNSTKKKDKLLTAAYKMASSPPDLESFMNPVDREPETEPVLESETEQPTKVPESGEPESDGNAKSKKLKKPSGQETQTSSLKKTSQNKKKDETKKRIANSKDDIPSSEKKKIKIEKKNSASTVPPSKKLSRDHDARQKIVMAIRFKLQRGFLSKEPPREQDIPGLSQYLTKLENIKDLELSVIRQTKVNKLLKAILKIPDIPLDSEFKFYERASKLLTKWSTLSDDANTRISDLANSKTSEVNVKDGSVAKVEDRSEIENNHNKEDA